MTATSCPASPSVEGCRIMSHTTKKIVDFALEIIEQDEFNDNDDGSLPCLDMSSRDTTSEDDDRCHPSLSCHPPLQHFFTRRMSSLSADGDEDEGSSVSTISAGDDTTTTSTRRRSLFKPYWEKNGETKTKLEPARCANVPRNLLIPVHPEVLASLREGTDRTFTTEENTYERTLESKESPDSRRKIFGQGCWSRASEPALTLQSLAPQLTYLRKARSDSLLLPGQPKSSCLRRGKFSSSCSATLRASSSSTSDNASVSFSEDVSVYVFQKSAERFAHEGWSQWFA